MCQNVAAKVIEIGNILKTLVATLDKAFFSYLPKSSQNNCPYFSPDPMNAKFWANKYILSQ